MDIVNFKNEKITVEPSRFGGNQHTTLGSLYWYCNGQHRIEFVRGDYDWYVFDVHQGQRLKSYSTRRELETAFLATNNNDGPFGCAELRL